jgi:hypothetical protein
MMGSLRAVLSFISGMKLIFTFLSIPVVWIYPRGSDREKCKDKLKEGKER